MRNFAFKTLAATLLAAIFCASGVQAKEISYDGNSTPYVKAKKKSARGNRVKYLPGSEETVAQRSARLKRECRGGVNAGACAGYTR